MKRFIENPGKETFDLIVIGGGITGAAVAYDAASRGLSVALLEKGDFGGATSAATSKLIHGGFRYLANLEFGLVRESLRERKTLFNIAPNLVHPIPVMVPAYSGGLASNQWVIKAGMVLYDLLSFDKGKTWDPAKSIKLHRALSREQALALEPMLPEQGLQKVFLYYDGANLFPERLTLAFLKSAVNCGALISNYCRVEGFLFSEDGQRRVIGVRARDLMHQRELELRGRLIINCGGPWADLILGRARGDLSSGKIRRSEGIHIITRKLLNGHMIAIVERSAKGFVVLPWRGHTLIGPTDKEYLGNPDDFNVSRAAVLELLETVNRSFGEKVNLKYEDVLHCYGGLRPLVEDRNKDVRQSSRKYEIYDNENDGLPGLITVEGGKYTTSRNLAQSALKMVAAKLGRNLGPCRTAGQHLCGCEIKDLNRFFTELKAANTDFAEKTVERLGWYYGREAEAVLELARQNSALAEPVNKEGEILAQVVYALRNEMALTLADILLHRTGIGGLGRPEDRIMRALGELAARELHWNQERKERELCEARALFNPPES